MGPDKVIIVQKWSLKIGLKLLIFTIGILGWLFRQVVPLNRSPHKVSLYTIIDDSGDQFLSIFLNKNSL